MGAMLTGEANRKLLRNLDRVELELAEMSRLGIEAASVSSVANAEAIGAVSLRWDDFCRYLRGGAARKTVLDRIVVYTARRRGIEFCATRARLAGEHAVGSREVTL